MMELVVCVGKDKENWGQVQSLIRKIEECERIVVVRSKEASDFVGDSRCVFVTCNTATPLMELRKELTDSLRKHIGGDFEIALSLASGNGKEHMALVGALLAIPVGIRLVAFTREGVQFLT